jgi:hypothetical protein
MDLILMKISGSLWAAANARGAKVLSAPEFIAFNHSQILPSHLILKIAPRLKGLPSPEISPDS